MEFWLASYPRSGNTYLRILMRNRYGVPSIDHECPEEMETPTLRGTSIARAHYRDPGVPQQMLGLKTHKPPEPGDTRPAIYIVRDGRDAMLSYGHFALSFVYKSAPEEATPERLHDTIRDLILEPNSPYLSWSQNVEAWLARENTAVVRFEELIADPARVADEAVARLGLKMTVVSELIPQFGELKAVDPQFFRRGKRGEWQEVFTPYLYDLFWERNGETMLKLGYPDLPPPRPEAPPEGVDIPEAIPISVDGEIPTALPVSEQPEVPGNAPPDRDLPAAA
jgi:hypothetical protein